MEAVHDAINKRKHFTIHVYTVYTRVGHSPLILYYELLVLVVTTFTKKKLGIRRCIIGIFASLLLLQQLDFIYYSDPACFSTPLFIMMLHYPLYSGLKARHIFSNACSHGTMTCAPCNLFSV